jgi:hypothetical protein
MPCNPRAINKSGVVRSSGRTSGDDCTAYDTCAVLFWSWQPTNYKAGANLIGARTSSDWSRSLRKLGLRFVNGFATDHGPEDFGVFEFFRRDGENVAVH